MTHRLNAKTLWLITLVATASCVVAMRYMAATFGYEVSLGAAPIVEFTGLFVAAGVFWLGFVIATLYLKSDTGRWLLWLVVGTGVGLRLIMFGTNPILETDHYRYLWDGAVVIEGHNPYGFTPSDVLAAASDVPDSVAQLGRASVPVLERVNQPQLNTIYPATAQAAFAIAAALKVFSLDAWRLILMLGEICALILLMAVLRREGLPLLNVGIYWMNPLVIKEVANTAHVDALLSPLLIATVLMIATNRRLLALVSISLAAGIKIWPLMLAPFATGRPADAIVRRLIGAAIFTIILLAVLILPMLLSASDNSIGVVAYAGEWRVNNPGFEAMRLGIWLVTQSTQADLIARIAVAVIVGAVVTRVCWNSSTSVAQLTDRMILPIATLLLLAPAVYPWYFLWLAALLALRPRLSLLVLSALLPLYYLRFYFAAVEQTEVFTGLVMWVEFVPVFALFAIELVRQKRLVPGQ